MEVMDVIMLRGWGMENDMNTQKLVAEIRHLNAMSDKLMAETRWYPLVVGTATAVAIIPPTKLFL